MHALGLGSRGQIREIHAAYPDLVPLAGRHPRHNARVVAKGQWFEADDASRASIPGTERDDLDRPLVRHPNAEVAAPAAQVTCAGPGKARQCASAFRTSKERGVSVNETECSRP